VEKKNRLQKKHDCGYSKLKNSYNTHRQKLDKKLDLNENDQDEYTSMTKMNNDKKDFDKNQYKSYNTGSIIKNNDFYNDFFENFEFNLKEKENQSIKNTITDNNSNNENFNYNVCKNEEENEYGNMNYKY